MNKIADKSAEWIYRGIWIFLVRCFRVPDSPPELPTAMTGDLRVFHPSRKYLSYLKLYFWVGLVLIDGLILIGWLVLVIQWPLLGWILAIPALLVAVVPDIVAYIAIHLRFDTIWYALSERGVHIRRGIIVITEHTISLANVQNISICRGPIEQFFGIGTLVVETAGASAGDEEHNSLSSGNRVVMVGLGDVDEIRKALMARVRAFRAAGLGDELDTPRHGRWNETDYQLLGEIRDALQTSPPE